jgi:hypothetical protein
MPHNDWTLVERLVRALDRRVYSPRFVFTDADIVLTFLWAVRHRRPVSWACTPAAWPHQPGRRLPSAARMTRRLAHGSSAHGLLTALAQELLAGRRRGPMVMLADGKPMTVAGHSRDGQATRGAYGLRGYKLHALADGQGRIAAFRVTTMKAYEPSVLMEMLDQAADRGLFACYLVADANFDTVELHRHCERLGGQLIAPRRRSRQGGGFRARTPACRRRSIDATETDLTGFGRALLRQRRRIEATFGTIETRFGLSRLPWHVRGLHRVTRWVNAALALGAITDLAKQVHAA